MSRPCPYLFGALLIVVGSGVIVGANFAPLALAVQFPAVARMGANTALGFVLLGIFLLLARSRWRKSAGLLMAVGVLAVAAQTQHFLAFYPTDGPWRLLANTLPEAGAWAGRMSSPTAYVFLLYALSGLLFAYRGAQRAEAAFFGLALGAMIALAYLASHLLRSGTSDLDHAAIGTVSPATAMLLTLAGVGMWRAADDQPEIRAWRLRSPGWDLFVQAASSVGTLLILGGISAGSLMRQGSETLAVALVSLLGLGAAAFLYWRIVPVLARLQRSEDELRTASQRQELLLNHAGQGIYGLDADGCITFANPAAEALLGYAADELAGQPMHPLLHHTRREGQAYPQSHCPIHITLADGLTRRVDDEVFWRADGMALEVEYVVAAIKGQGGILGAVVLFSDITERLRDAAALARWQHIFDHAEWGVVIVDSDGRSMEQMNPAFARMHGDSVEALTGRPLVDLLVPECGRDLTINMCLAYEKGHHIWESWHLRRDGTRFPVQLDVTNVMDSAGQVLYLVVNLQDITERRQAEAALLNNAAHMTRVQRQAKLGSWWLDAPRNEYHWSEETHRIFGVPEGTRLSSEFVFDCIHPDDRALVERAWQAALLGKPYDVQHRIVADGEVKWVRERAELESFPDASLRRAEGTVQDITEIKRHEDELLRSRQNLRNLAAHHEKIREAERSSMAREIHDELGQYLTALRMDAAMLKLRFGAGNPDLVQHVDGMKATIDTTIGVVRNLAAAMRPAALDMGLASAAEWLLAGFQDRTGIHYRLEMPAGEELRLDDEHATAAFRILQESLTNIARHAQASEVRVRLECLTNALVIDVCDNGIGFDPAEVRTRKTFGLMGIRERTLMFGGEAQIDSAPGSGTTLHVQIPLSSRA